MPCCVKLSPRLAALREMRARRSPGARGRAARGAGGAEPPTPPTRPRAHAPHAAARTRHSRLARGQLIPFRGGERRERPTFKILFLSKSKLLQFPKPY